MTWNGIVVGIRWDYAKYNFVGGCEKLDVPELLNGRNMSEIMINHSILVLPYFQTQISRFACKTYQEACATATDVGHRAEAEVDSANNDGLTQAMSIALVAMVLHGMQP